MKKIKLYIGILVSLVLFGACDQLNDYPVFDDADAFVAITAERFSAPENAGTLNVPVRLTSLAAKSATVTFELIDGTAKSGEDFQLKGGASVLTFDGTAPVKNIEIDILPHTGTFTGDRSFKVILKTANGVDIGSIDTATVTINDLDHPLAAILGAYSASALHYFNGSALSWDNTLFEKDPDGDVTKVWITGNILGTSGAGAGSKVYGVVNDDMTEITVPVHQKVVNASYNAFFDGIDADGNIMEDGAKVTFVINVGATTTIELKENAAGILAYDIASGDYAGYYQIAEKVVYTKK
jgi:hypothetical protein